MARIRSIKPETFTDADLCELSPLHRLLYIGMWGHADREGKLLDKPRELKVKILPYDECDADAMLWDLAEAGFVVRYEYDGVRYLEIPNLPKHQKFHREEVAKGYPHVAASTLRTRCQQPASSLPALVQHPASSAVNGELCTVNGELVPVNGGGSSFQKKAAAEDFGQSPRVEPRRDAEGAGTERVVKSGSPNPTGEFVMWAFSVRKDWTRLEGKDPLPKDAVRRIREAIEAEGEARVRAGYLAFLRDRYGGQLDPPWPMRFFLSETQLEKYLAAGEPWPADERTAPGPAPPCVVCGEPSETEIWEHRVCLLHFGEWTVEENAPVTVTDMSLWVEARRQKGNAA